MKKETREKLESAIREGLRESGREHLTEGCVISFCSEAWILCDHKTFCGMTDNDFDAGIREVADDYGLTYDFCRNILPEIYDFDTAACL